MNDCEKTKDELIRELQKVQQENNFLTSKGMLDLFFAQSLDGFFFMMLDEPVYWNESTDKEKTLDYVFAHQHVTTINDAMLKQYVAEREQFIGFTPKDFFAHDIEYGKHIWRELFDMGRLHINTNERRFDNSPVLIEGDYICLYDSEKRITGLFGIQRDVTEPKRIEHELISNETKFRALFEFANDAIFIIDEKVFIDCNKKTEEFFGCPKDFLIGHSPFEFSPERQPDGSISSEQSVKNINNALSGVPQFFEWKHIRYDGTPFDAEVSLNMIEIEGEKFLQAIVRDISDRKKAEAAIEQSESNYRNLVGRMPDGVYKSTHDGRFVEVNPAMIDMLGYSSKEELMSVDIKTQLYFEPTDRESIMLQEKLQEMGVFRMKKKDGSEIWVEDHGWYILAENGDITFHEGILRDITDRKKTEDALLESENRYRIFINSTSDMVFLKDDNLKYLFVNDSLAAFFEAKVSDMIGKTDFDFLPEKMAQNCLTSDNLALDSNSVVEEDEQVGDKVYSIHKFRVPMINGKYGVGGNLRDITARIDADKKLKKQTEELRELNSTKDKFLSIISHDLRSPFQSLLGFTQILAEELPTLTIEEIQGIAVNMRSSANKFFNLLEDLLQWSQLQRGLINITQESFVLLDRIVPAIDLNIDSVNKKMISLSYDIPENLTVKADPQMFESLLHNLISNATKFSSKGGKIVIGATHLPGGIVQVFVKDTGIGMSKEIVENLFMIGVQSNRKGTEGEPSTGLGLIICKDFVEMLGGKIWVESEEGKGSTFYFTIPAGQDIPANLS